MSNQSQDRGKVSRKRRRPNVQRLSNNDPSLRFFFYIKESGTYTSLTRSSSVMKSFNSVCSDDKSWNLGEFYPLDYGCEGFWKGCLLHVGAAVSTNKLEQKVSSFITDHKEAGNLTDAILQEFVQEQCEINESESESSIDLQEDTDDIPISKSKKHDLGKNGLKSSSGTQIQTTNQIMPQASNTKFLVISEWIATEHEKMKKFQPHSKQIECTDLDATMEQQENMANEPRLRNGEVTLERIYSKLSKLDAYVRSEFRKLKKNNKETSFQRVDPGPGGEFTDPDGNTFSLANITKSNPSSFIRQFAIKWFGMPYLMSHVVDPGKISSHQSASKEVVKELKDTLLKVFQANSADAGEAMWNTARKSLNQMFAEKRHATKQRDNSSSIHG